MNEDQAYIRDGHGWENGERVQVIHDEIHDRGNPLVAEIEGASKVFLLALSTASLELLNFCAEDMRHPGQLRSEASIGRHLVSLLHCTGHPLVAAMSQRDIAEEMHCTVACISKIENKFRDQFGIAGLGQKSEEAREAYRKRAKEVHARKGKPAQSSNSEPAKGNTVNNHEEGETL